VISQIIPSRARPIYEISKERGLCGVIARSKKLKLRLAPKFITAMCDARHLVVRNRISNGKFAEILSRFLFVYDTREPP